MAHPVDYLLERLRLTGSLLGIGGQGPGTTPWGTDFAYHALENPWNYGYTLASFRRYSYASKILSRFLGPGAAVPMDRAFVYLVILLAAAGYVFRKRATGRGTVACLLTMVVANQFLLFFATPAAAFRYVALLPPAACLALLFVVVDWRRRRLAR